MPLFRKVFQRHHSTKEARKLDANNDGTISWDELYKYIKSQEKLWAMLAVNLNLPEEQCFDIATDVAFQLAKTKKSKSVRDLRKSMKDFTSSEREREPTIRELQSFLDFVKKPKGEQEFFHRAVFQAFDQDENGYLDLDELDKFLEIFYEADSIFANDSRLPPKNVLKKMVLKEFDADGDCKLGFQDIRFLISGGAKSISNNRNLLTAQ